MCYLSVVMLLTAHYVLLMFSCYVAHCSLSVAHVSCNVAYCSVSVAHCSLCVAHIVRYSCLS